MCGTGCQRDQLIGGRDEDVLLRGVRLRLRMVRVAQVMHRVEQWFCVFLEFLHHRGEHVGTDRVEAEVHMENVELVVIRTHPAGLEHQRRPPSPGHGATVLRNRIMQTHYIIRSVWVRQVTHIDVRSRHRSNAQQFFPLLTVD